MTSNAGGSSALVSDTAPALAPTPMAVDEQQQQQQQQQQHTLSATLLSSASSPSLSSPSSLAADAAAPTSRARVDPRDRNDPRANRGARGNQRGFRSRDRDRFGQPTARAQRKQERREKFSALLSSGMVVGEGSSGDGAATSQSTAATHVVGSSALGETFRFKRRFEDENNGSGTGGDDDDDDDDHDHDEGGSDDGDESKSGHDASGAGKAGVSRKKMKMAGRDPTGSRMREYEEVYTHIILDPRKCFIVRLDGHKFSTFTKDFKKPYDARLSDAMALTLEDLVREYNCVFGYTQTDELTLVFAPHPLTKQASEMFFNGKVMKIASLIAAYCSVRFNYHMNAQTFDPEKEPDLYDRVRSHTAHFDGRAFNVPSYSEAAYNILWRAKFDGYRNSVSALANHYLGSKKVFGLSTNQKLARLLGMDIDWREWPNKFKYGTFVKKEFFIKKTEDSITHEPVEAVRSRTAQRSFDIEALSDVKLLSLLFASSWNEYDAGKVPEEPFREVEAAGAGGGESDEAEAPMEATQASETKEASG